MGNDGQSSEIRCGDSDFDCTETIGRIYYYLDGELTDERRDAIRHHLDECPPCVDAYGFEVELRQVIANRCRDHVPESLLERVRKALDQERQRAQN